MSKPYDIPKDVMKSAANVVVSLGIGGTTNPNPDGFAVRDAVARAILAERGRCAKVADDRAAICADAVAKIEAGDLYPGIPTARASETCARMEAEHIARLIRNGPSAIRHPQETTNG